MRQTRMVLVVEDHPATQSALADVLTEQGWEVALAFDGETAIRLAREVHPAVVWLDLNLPTISGFDVCEQIRADPMLNDVSIVMTSARHSLDVRANSLEAGADAYLPKPYDVDELMRVVEHVCRSRNAP